MPIYTPGKLILSKIQQYPVVIGEAFGGGYFAGYISHTQDGNPTHALIVAPRATGFTDLQWKTTSTTNTGTTSTFDGVANTAAMVTSGIADHPAAQFCVNRSIGGYTDWYLPAYHELNIAYQNLKPSIDGNDDRVGINAYSVPRLNSNFTASFPSQTILTVFKTNGAEAFEADVHWSSTADAGSVSAAAFDFKNGPIYGINKINSRRLRAFRRIAL
jgi:hypothetical protein